MKQPIQIIVRGKRHTWGFTFEGDPKHLADWRADGLQVYEVCNTIPAWAVDFGLLRLWVAVQDAWRWMRVW